MLPSKYAWLISHLWDDSLRLGHWWGGGQLFSTCSGFKFSVVTHFISYMYLHVSEWPCKLPYRHVQYASQSTLTGVHLSTPCWTVHWHINRPCLCPDGGPLWQPSLSTRYSTLTRTRHVALQTMNVTCLPWLYCNFPISPIHTIHMRVAKWYVQHFTVQQSVTLFIVKLLFHCQEWWTALACVCSTPQSCVSMMQEW